MIRYVLDGETLSEAICHAGMMAAAEPGPEKGYVIVCKDCGQPIDDHQNPGDCEIFKSLYNFDGSLR